MFEHDKTLVATKREYAWTIIMKIGSSSDFEESGKREKKGAINWCSGAAGEEAAIDLAPWCTETANSRPNAAQGRHRTSGSMCSGSQWGGTKVERAPPGAATSWIGYERVRKNKSLDWDGPPVHARDSAKSIVRRKERRGVELGPLFDGGFQTECGEHQRHRHHHLHLVLQRFERRIEHQLPHISWRPILHVLPSRYKRRRRPRGWHAVGRPTNREILRVRR